MQLLNVEPIVYNLWERETLETNRNHSLHNSPVETVSLTAPDCHEMLQLIPDCLSQAPSDPECPMLHLYSFLVMCFFNPLYYFTNLSAHNNFCSLENLKLLAWLICYYLFITILILVSVADLQYLQGVHKTLYENCPRFNRFSNIWSSYETTGIQRKKNKLGWSRAKLRQA